MIKKIRDCSINELHTYCINRSCINCPFCGSFSLGNCKIGNADPDEEIVIWEGDAEWIL